MAIEIVGEIELHLPRKSGIMCNPTAAAIELKHGHNNHKQKSSIMSKIWPLATPIVIFADHT